MYLIPEPKEWKKNEGACILSYQSSIVLDAGLREEAQICASSLKDYIKTWTGFMPAIVKGRRGTGEGPDIILRVDASVGTQAYCLTVKETQITACGGDIAGLFYAVATLCQVLSQCGGSIGCMEIADEPEIKNRGYYLDQTRGRVLKLSELKKIADRLCFYKVNQFQLYVEHTYLFSGLSEMWRDETPLTAEEIMELDAYCRARQIELVPSLASFGHLYTLLSTKSYAHFCEREDAEKQPFSFWDRMRHHTVNVADDAVLPFIKGIIREYMELFSSDKFNFCADETFDLGKGRSKELADARGVHRIYIDYVKELAEFLVGEGKTPMFWGDIICGEPELIKELPEETICLTWGYAPDQREDECRKMAQAGAKQYLCPGVCGWNQWVNLLEDSYKNIVRMCGYAKKHGALGILNTDWGDFGHVNAPDFSTPGLIYGAAFSWNSNPVPYEEMNRRIAAVAYHDGTEEFVNLVGQIPRHSLFSWWDAVMHYEITAIGWKEPDGSLPQRDITGEGILAASEGIRSIRRRLSVNACRMDSSVRQYLRAYDIILDGIAVWNEVGFRILGVGRAPSLGDEAAYALADRLETWFMAYKAFWRESSREGDLARIAAIVFWYADLLRGRQMATRRKKEE